MYAFITASTLLASAIPDWAKMCMVFNVPNYAWLKVIELLISANDHEEKRDNGYCTFFY